MKSEKQANFLKKFAPAGVVPPAGKKKGRSRVTSGSARVCVRQALRKNCEQRRDCAGLSHETAKTKFRRVEQERHRIARQTVPGAALVLPAGRRPHVVRQRDEVPV